MKRLFAVFALLLSLNTFADTLQFCTATSVAASSSGVSPSITTTLASSSTIASGACGSTPPIPPGSFFTIANSAGGYFTHWSGLYNLQFCNGGCTSPQPIDVSKFDAIFQPWPGQNGLIVYTQLPVTKYFSAQFTVPAGKLQPNYFGAYRSGETNNQANYSITISATGGDFSNPTQAGSTVIPGCWKNNLSTSGVLQWNADPSKSCVLTNGKTYYLNFVNADISAVLPNGRGTMTSTKRATCTAGTYCVLPIYNGPRNFP